jgi:hypothetical protein
VRSFPHWLAGPFTGLGERTTWTGFGWLLVVLFGAWLAILAGVRSVSRRALVVAIVVVHVLFLLAPPLLSADIFGYVGMARLPAVHHLDPTCSARRGPSDPIRTYLRWRDARSAYGPLFTALSEVARAARHRGRRLDVQVDRVPREPRDGGDGLAAGRAPRNRPALRSRARGAQPDRPRVRGRRRHNDALVVALTVAGIALVEGRRAVGGGAAFVSARR